METSVVIVRQVHDQLQWLAGCPAVGVQSPIEECGRCSDHEGKPVLWDRCLDWSE